MGGAGAVRVGGVAGMLVGDWLGGGVAALQRMLAGLLLPGHRRLGLQILAIVLTEGLGLVLDLVGGLGSGLGVTSSSFGFSLFGGEIVLAFNALRRISNHVL